MRRNVSMIKKNVRKAGVEKVIKGKGVTKENVMQGAGQKKSGLNEAKSGASAQAGSVEV